MNPLKKIRHSEKFKTLLFYTLRVLPIKKHKIVFCNFSGKRCGDSPRSISDSLKTKHPDWDLVWLSHPKYTPPIPEGCRKVNFGMHSLRMIYELASAKVWVDSHSKFPFTRKRKGQYYLETWHGGLCLKKIEGDASNVLDTDYIRRVRANTALADVFLSNAKWTTELYRRAFWFQGEVLEEGLPRNDILVNPSNSTKIHKYFHIDPSTKILLYAPTFRSDNRIDCYNLDAEALCKKLEETFHQKWVVIIRLHPMAMKLEIPFQFNDHIINGTSFYDTQQLLIESDLLITDYSSCIFDFALTKRPSFIFATDEDDYKLDRGFYFALDDLPFPVARSNEDLLKNIEDFNIDSYMEKWNSFANNVGLQESGHATEDAVNLIEKWICDA